MHSLTLPKLTPRVRRVVRQTVPPIVWTTVAAGQRRGWLPVPEGDRITAGEVGEQDLAAYWDPEYAKVLDTWGLSDVWIEIPLILSHMDGPVLDVACGTGKTMEMLGPLHKLEMYGCDISAVLIEKAVERGIARDRLEICDARNTPYEDGFFAASYSIGSLEHFPDEAIVEFLHECKRVTAGPTFHQIPVAGSGNDEGWVRQGRQSYYNNSVEWWITRFRAVYPSVAALDSTWAGGRSVGKWFICAP